MGSRISRRFWRHGCTVAILLFAIASGTAQDPDPNSPTPVLLSEQASTRALAQMPGQVRGRGDLARATSPAFELGDKVELFFTNVSLMEGEGANAFRVYAVDKVNHQFRFPVLELEEMPNTDGVFRATILLKDELGFWDKPEGDGDVLIYLTWRGLASNKVRLGLGKLGDGVKDDPSMRPTPFGTKSLPAARPDAPDAIGYRFAGDRMRFAEQATFGPNRQLDSTLMRFGLRAWINSQFAMPYPSASNPYPNNILQPANQPTLCDGGADDVPANCGRDTYTQYQPQTWFFREAFYGDAQLKHRVAWALGQIWVTSGNDIQQGRHMVEWHKVLSKHAFGNYRDLMKEMTLNPTMGEYLNMRESTRTSPNENYAREIKQLFAIGLFMLNQDGTLQRDTQNNPIPTYTQDEVNAFTRVFTGWSFCSVPASCPSAVAGTVNFIDPMLLNPGITNAVQNRHDIHAKTLLTYPGSAATQTIAACPPTGTGACGLTCPTSGTGNCTLQAGFTSATALAGTLNYANASLERAIDNLFYHPNVGPFVGRILIQHMVTSDPSPAYVSRVAAAFNNNGQGVRGDMKAVIRAILLDPEARGDVKTDPNFGKLREPVQLFTNFARTFNVRSASGTGLSDGSVSGDRACGRPEFNNMAQVPFRSPTVFNYYPPDYSIPGTSLNGPEFAILTTGTAIARATFINRMTFVTNPTNDTYSTAPIPVNGVDCPNGTSFDFADLVALSQADATGGQLVDELNRRMLHSTMSPQMRSSILTAVTAYPTTSPNSRVRQAIYLVATSSQYQVQR